MCSRNVLSDVIKENLEYLIAVGTVMEDSAQSTYKQVHQRMGTQDGAHDDEVT